MVCRGRTEYAIPRGVLVDQVGVELQSVDRLNIEGDPLCL